MSKNNENNAKNNENKANNNENTPKTNKMVKVRFISGYWGVHRLCFEYNENGKCVGWRHASTG